REGGRGSAVIEKRMQFQELMRERFEAVIESATGRRVIGFMSGNQQEPDMMCEVFILAPTDLVTSDELRSPRPAPDAHPPAGKLQRSCPQTNRSPPRSNGSSRSASLCSSVKRPT